MKFITKWSAAFIFTALSIMFVIPVIYKRAQLNKPWEEATAKTSRVSRNDDGTVTIENVRNWSYDAKSIRSKDWINSTSVNPKEIKRVWFILQPLAKWPSVGHTFLSFEMEDGNTYALSIEARRTEGQEYSPIKGLFRAYELNYAWGTEKDLVTRRLFYLDFPLYMYELHLEKEEVMNIFNAFADATEDVYNKPRFYNTISANCTNILARTINSIHSRKIPYDISWYFTGGFDTFLIREGFIKKHSTTHATKKRADLMSQREALTPLLNASPQDFSSALRTLI